MTRMMMALGLALVVLAGCETVEGAGQDLSAAGNAIAAESREAQSAM